MECNIFSAMLIGPRADQQDCLFDGIDIFQKDLLIRKSRNKADRLLMNVCDGMGGHESGERASRFVCEQLSQRHLNNSLTPDNIREALADIQSLSFANLSPNCGTTVAGILLENSMVTAFNAGDSRVYKLSEEKITPLSHDHSLVQELVDKDLMSGERAFRHPLKNYIEFGIGPIFKNMQEEREVFLAKEEAKSGSWYLICSDGMTDILLDMEIHELLMPDPIGNGSRLFNTVRNIGPSDNVSFIIVEIC
ncbi:MAG: serine/threonine-protein phosphatase [Deltaproteobacteria bacterium]|nr:serine/threonine-protein phosphatase [Deltaproteobacteria bacterium]